MNENINIKKNRTKNCSCNTNVNEANQFLIISILVYLRVFEA